MKKKVVAFILSLCILGIAFNTVALGASSVNLNIAIDKNTDLNVGDKFVVTLSSSNWVDVVKGIAAFNVKLQYDSNKFLYEKIDIVPESKIVINDNSGHSDDFSVSVANPNVLAILYMDYNFTTPIPAEGNILKITFSVKESAPTGKYIFNLTGDKVIVDGFLPSGKSVPVVYPEQILVSVNNPNASAVSSSSIVTSSASVSSVPSIPSADVSSTGTVSIVTDKPITPSLVDNNIEKLPETITTPEEKKIVEKIREQYEKLPDEKKAEVINIEKLVDAEKQAEAIPDPVKPKSNILKIVAISLILVLLLGAGIALYILKFRKPKTL